ncbi:MAG: hypothetical protein ACRDP7_20955, partial [Trebonia sp.]
MTAVLLLAVACSLVASAPAARASAAKAQQPPLAISITGMKPTVASADATVTVSGTLANHTGSPLPGTVVQGLTSTRWFQYPSQMTDFTNSTTSS